MRDYEKILSDLRLKTLLVQSGMADPLYLDAADAIAELLAKVPKWISVEERLPEAWKPVLAFDPIGNGEIGIAFIVGSLNTVVWRGVGFTNTAYPPSITHWMPLPSTEGLK